MTDPTPGSERDDELASAYLDGEATAEEAARVEAEPALRSRVEELRRVAGLVGRADRLPAGAQDRLLAAALEHVGHGPDAAVDAGGGDELARVRRRRPSAGALAAAAAVLAVLLAVGVGGLVSEDDARDTASGSDAADEAATTDDAGAAAGSAESTDADDAAGEQGTGTLSAPAPIAAADLDDLADQVARRLEGPRAGGGSDGAGPTEEDDAGDAAVRPLDCDPRALTSADLGALLLELDGTLAGAPVGLSVHASPEGPRLLVTDAGCSLVAERLL